jgi:hypothetical protein
MKLLTCRETTRLVSQGLDRELAFGERVALRLHFAICLGCRRTRGHFELLRKAVRELADADVTTPV